MELKGKKVLFLGDSITEGAGVTNQENRFDNRLVKKYGITAYNYGVSGTRIAHQRVPSELRPSFDMYFSARAERMISEADIVVVFGGTNDYGHGDAYFGSFEDTTCATFCGAYRHLLRLLKSKYPTAEIVIMTPASRNDCEMHLAYASPDKKKFVEYVDAEIKIAKEEGVHIIDLFRDLGIDATDENQNREYLTDGLHLNDKAHGVLADRLGDFLEKL